MARFFSSSKIISGLVANAINRRGFSVNASNVVTTVNTSTSIIKKTGLEEEIVGCAKVSWAPDPKTGFYSPENVADEIDPVELRAMSLKKH